MNDPQIRELLLPTLTGAVIEELPVGPTRADVALLTSDEMHGYEIKGDGDTLKRVPMQLAAYAGVFDSVTFVIVERHLAKLLPLLPDWVGVSVAAAGAIWQHRAAGLNPSRSREFLAALLVQADVRALLARYNVPRTSRMRRWEEWDALAKADYVPLVAVSDFVRERLIATLPERLAARVVRREVSARDRENQRRERECRRTNYGELADSD